jgi:hypothetical protein
MLNGMRAMSKARPLTSKGVGLLPILLMGVTHLSLPPLQTVFELEPRLMYAYYAFAVILGVVLLRRTRVVKDHEYNRVKAMKKIRHVYEAEERGIWQTDVHLDGTMDAVTQAGLSQPVGGLSAEQPEMQLGEDTEVEVQMLSEAAHVIKANARVSGESSFDEDTISGTIGAQQKAGPMDRFLDGLFGLFGIDSRAAREERRQAMLRQAALQSPVVAQRPVAPLRMNKSDDGTEVNMTSMSDTGGVETVISTTGTEITAGEPVSKDYGTVNIAESLESMAMMGQAPSSATAFTTAGPSCRGCSAPVGDQEKFCPHCGLDL